MHIIIIFYYDQDRLEKLHKNIAKETARHKAAIEAGQWLWSTPCVPEIITDC